MKPDLQFRRGVGLVDKAGKCVSRPTEPKTVQPARRGARKEAKILTEVVDLLRDGMSAAMETALKNPAPLPVVGEQFDSDLKAAAETSAAYWKAKCEALIAERRAQTLARVKKHRDKARKARKK